MEQIIIFIILAIFIIVPIGGLLCILCLIGYLLCQTCGWFKWLYHNIFGLHEPLETDSFNFDIENGYIKATCKYCGKEIISNNGFDWKEKE